MSDGSGDLSRTREDMGWPLVVWWWDPAEDRDVPPTRAIRWVELVGAEERRGGTSRISKRTSNPLDLDDPAVRVELHHELERRLGTTIRVDHALRHLDQLRVDRRLAARGYRLNTLSLEDYQQDLIGGVAARVTGDQWSGEVVVRSGLSANARDGLLVWAERALSSVESRTGSPDFEALGWTSTRSGGWQRLLYATE